MVLRICAARRQYSVELPLREAKLERMDSRPVGALPPAHASPFMVWQQQLQQQQQQRHGQAQQQPE